MKKLGIIIVAMLVSALSFSQDFNQEDTYYAHLLEINKEWQFHKDACPEGTVKFNSDQQRIQLHLKLVCNTLKNETPQGLSDSQLSNRLQLIHDLELYAEGGVFPTNLYHNVRQPYFVDDYGVHCAVGYMMHKSGNDGLVERIVDEHNYDYIRDIKTAGVTCWANEFGFTLDELKWIQPSYPPQSYTEPLGAGTNGPVSNLLYEQYNNRVIITGDFTTLDNLPCLNIGCYQDNQLSCLGQGIDGTINDVFVNSDGVYVVGEFNNGTDLFPAAFYDGNDWFYVSIPGRKGAVGITGIYTFPQSNFELIIEHPSIATNNQELWSYSISNGWSLDAVFHGEVNDIEAGGSQRVYVGRFSSVTTSYLNGVHTTNNAIIRDVYFDNWTPIQGTDISDNVLAAEFVGSSIYFAGECSNGIIGNDICISRYLNGVLQPVQYFDYSFWDYDSVAVIHDLDFDNGSYLYFAGDFSLNAGMTIGRKVGRINLVLNLPEPLAVLNEKAEAICLYGGTVYVGGHIMTNYSSQNINHLGRILGISSIGDPIADLEIELYPNPFTAYIETGDVENGAYRLMSMSGQVIKEGDFNNHKIHDLDDVPNGTFILMIDAKEGLFKSKVVK